MRLAGKVALVTGAAGGIGRGIALKFAAEGADVVVNDLSLMAAESVSDKIKEMRRKALPVQADVSKAQETERMFDEAVAAFGKVDILVCAAGVRKDAPIYAMTETDWDQVMDVHLKGCFNAVKQAQKHMVGKKYGKIIIVASPVPSGLGRSNEINYSTANAGLVGLTVSLAIELGKYNINVNCIAPDFIETQMIRENARRDGMYMEDFKKAALARIPLRRLGAVEDVSNVALFYASDESGYVTGQVIKVSGGP
ncbi:MAG: SDR family oxidoreductase [Deltaproteobacteria bacterium]|nr:SDR family oxidoreductase [Deltaproteobacteria bacterium]